MNERGGADGYMRGVYRRSHEERLAVTTPESSENRKTVGSGISGPTGHDLGVGTTPETAESVAAPSLRSILIERATNTDRWTAVLDDDLADLIEIAEAAAALIRDEDVRLGDIVQIRLSNAVGKAKWLS